MSCFLFSKDPNVIRPRRNELVKMGVLEEKYKRKCCISNRRAIVWGIKGNSGVLNG